MISDRFEEGESQNMAILKAKVGGNTMIAVLVQELFREKKAKMIEIFTVLGRFLPF